MRSCTFFTIRTHTHTYVHTCMRSCPFLTIRSCWKRNRYVDIHTYIHTYIHTHIHTCMRSDFYCKVFTSKREICTYIHTYIHTCMRSDFSCKLCTSKKEICTYIHTIRACVHTHMHTYIQMSNHIAT